MLKYESLQLLFPEMERSHAARKVVERVFPGNCPWKNKLVNNVSQLLYKLPAVLLIQIFPTIILISNRQKF
jgi:hypothetical protein